MEQRVSWEVQLDRSEQNMCIYRPCIHDLLTVSLALELLVACRPP